MASNILKRPLKLALVQLATGTYPLNNKIPETALQEEEEPIYRNNQSFPLLQIPAWSQAESLQPNMPDDNNNKLFYCRAR